MNKKQKVKKYRYLNRNEKRRNIQQRLNELKK